MTRIPHSYLQKEVVVMTAAVPAMTAHANAFRNKVIQGLVLLFVVVALLMYAPVWLVVIVIFALGGISLIEAVTVQVVADSFMQIDSPKAMLVRFYVAGIVVAGTLAACRLYMSEDGLLTVFYACFVGVMITDGAAQLTGMFWYRVFGRRTSMAFGLIRPFKITSPKKTVIGFIGGVLLGGVAVNIVDLVAGGGLPWWFVIAIPVCAEAGDLIASYAKRKIGTKDFGIYTRKPLLGEHGGVLDRGDGHWFTFMVIGALSFMFL
ncbi:phosphatidate cytidylyltransferase [bacterium]|nr:MAG: phosphatidate cytidylyltransferase [bacterium]